MMGIDQKILSPDQVAAFYHDEFVESQVHDFVRLILADNPAPGLIADIGGGCGYFADELSRAGDVKVRVIDLDPTSVAECREKGIDARVGDALSPDRVGDESVVCFNLILHHLVADNDAATRALQEQALAYWRNSPATLFINEYIYESYVGTLSGRLIYEITKSALLSAAARLVARFIPSLRANTFGVGVRFRAHKEWLALFRTLGFNLVAYSRGPEEGVSLARRMLLIRSCRRDSYALRASVEPSPDRVTDFPRASAVANSGPA